MSAFLVFALVLAVGVAAFFVGRSRAAAAASAGGQKMHSRAHYHGWWAFLLATGPALALLVCWSIGANTYLHSQTAERVASHSSESAGSAASLVMSLARGLNRLDDPTNPPQTMDALNPLLAGKGVTLATDTQDYMIPLAVEANRTMNRLSWIGGILALALAVLGAFYGLSQIAVRARARDKVEKVVLGGLFSASTLAIVTTIGIVLSMLFQTITFFGQVSPWNFFFGTVWDPRFAAAGSGGSEGQFGLIPLLAGTLYIALVALLVAVPGRPDVGGLHVGVCLEAYPLDRQAGAGTARRHSDHRLRHFRAGDAGALAARHLRALAGGSPFIQAQSIFTAGLVMGVMLIPVVSSLSDDIINAVPQAMRDGSLGLGATRSETIRKVILPAALPGIVGAVLLTASRAIGETMIVVLAAGVAANLTANPFEAMTTITVKIVNQLTGDLEFNSPQTLVAFALGITLFFVTLVMNIVALAIVRKYREQYE